MNFLFEDIMIHYCCAFSLIRLPLFLSNIDTLFLDKSFFFFLFQCTKSHNLICLEFESKGSCSKGRNCRLVHENHNKGNAKRYTSAKPSSIKSLAQEKMWVIQCLTVYNTTFSSFFFFLSV